MAGEFTVGNAVAVPPGLDGRRAFVGSQPTARAGQAVSSQSSEQPSAQGAAPAQPQARQRDSQELERLRDAIRQLEQKLAEARTDLQFRVDEDTDRMVVSVIDAQDGKVVRQIPSEVALRIARLLDNEPGALLETVA